ncbi:MAG: 30S ribosomal protein S6 [Clostridia bacterium]|nr:30S ribosomal protein S6 [Clostridia bacterium]MBQ9786256.1 30S ribosomal protein S6 [Clostridia bacterium]
MNKYELLYIISSDAEEQTREAIIKKFADMVTASGGTVDTLDKIGMKKFAYPIHDRQEGYYVLMNFTSNPDLPLEMEKQMRITEFFVRKMFIRKD